MHSRPRALTVLVMTVLLLAGAPARGSTTADEPAPVPAGAAVWPLSPVPAVGERFDPPDSRWGPGHRGVDLRGTVGQAVRAALAGRITFAGSLAGRGVVVVEHGATRTTYEPVDAAVSVGDRVGAGARIGTLQLGGSHCFPAACLHWGLRRQGAGDAYLDPLTLVGAGPVRLLPLGVDAAGTASLNAPGARGSARLPTWASAPPAPTVPARPTVGPSGSGALFRQGAVP